MRSDLDALMQSAELDAILITGPAQHNPPMYYLTGGVHLTQAELIKLRNEEPILFFNPMERDEAAQTGLRTKDLTDYDLKQLLAETKGDQVEAYALRYKKMLSEFNFVSGRVAIYGKIDAGTAFAVFSRLEHLMPGLTIVGEVKNSVLLQAMASKEESEITRMRRMGEITTHVVGEVADFLTSHRVKDQTLVKSDGTPLTIAEIKRRINLWLAENGAENPEGTIFAISRDAGVPHSVGNPGDVIRLGQTIVFDIFPCEAGGGYFYDFTRTWCLGFAPDEVQELYEDVLAVYRQIMSELEPNALCKSYQARTCELFEERGHPTIKDDITIKEGYLHSVGHGLGLNVHERPWFGRGATEEDVLAPGVVVTIEPGLYYPNRGMGCRLEDTVYVRPDGIMEILAEFPHDLVLPMK